MAQEILVHDNFVGSDLTPLPAEINGDIQPIEITQEILEQGIVDYLLAVTANQTDILSVFPNDFHIDPRNAVKSIFSYLPFQKERPAQALAFAQYIDTIVQSTPANLGTPQVKLRLLIARTPLSPSNLMSAGIAMSIAALDTGQHRVRSCLVPATSDAPDLEDMTVSAGAMIMCQQMPFLNQQTDLRKWGWDSPAGLYTERERALTVTKNVDGPEPESLSAQSPYSLGSPMSATMLAGTSNGMGTSAKLMSGELINPGEIAGEASARGREMAAEFAESDEASHPGSESAAELGARQYAAGELPMAAPQGWSRDKAAAALAAGGVAAYEGFEKKHEAQVAETELTTHQHEEARHNAEFAKKTAYKEQGAPAPTSGHKPKDAEETQESRPVPRGAATETAEKSEPAEAGESENTGGESSENTIEALATETAAAEAEVTSAGAPESTMDLEPERPASAPVPTAEAIAEIGETQGNDFSEPEGFATADLPSGETLAETRTSAPVSESGVEAPTPSLPVEALHSDVAVEAAEPASAPAGTEPSTAAEAPAAARTEAAAETAPTAEPASAAPSPSEGGTGEAPSLSRQETPEPRSLEQQESLTVKENNPTPTSEAVRHDAEAPGHSEIPEPKEPSSEAPEPAQESSTASAESRPAAAEGESSPSLSRQEFPESRSLEHQEGLTVKENNATPTSEAVRHEAEAPGHSETSEVKEPASEAPEPAHESNTASAESRSATRENESSPSLSRQEFPESRSLERQEGLTVKENNSVPTSEGTRHNVEAPEPGMEHRAEQAEQPHNDAPAPRQEAQRDAVVEPIRDGPTRYDDLRAETPQTHEQSFTHAEAHPSNAAHADTAAQPHAAAPEGPTRYEELRAETPATHQASIDPHQQPGNDPTVLHTDRHDMGNTHIENRHDQPDIHHDGQAANLSGASGSHGTGRSYADNLDNGPQPSHNDGATHNQNAREFAKENFDMHHHPEPDSGRQVESQDARADSGQSDFRAYDTDHSAQNGALQHGRDDYINKAPMDFGPGHKLHDSGVTPQLAAWLGIGAAKPSNALSGNDRTDAAVMKEKLAEAKAEVKHGDGRHPDVKNAAQKQMAEEENIIPHPQPPPPSPEPD